MRTDKVTIIGYVPSATPTNYTVRLLQQAVSFRLIFYIGGNRYNWKAVFNPYGRY